MCALHAFTQHDWLQSFVTPSTLERLGGLRQVNISGVQD